ncbi:hypothetical protein E2320_012126 [Naja naja]|nr:hypothetical protein E2320_012126 [Naja naja]
MMPFGRSQAGGLKSYKMTLSAAERKAQITGPSGDDRLVADFVRRQRQGDRGVSDPFGVLLGALREEKMRGRRGGDGEERRVKERNAKEERQVKKREEGE